ncbi:hypothetical protein [Corynebacterium sp. TAE3-ERU2]|nr:hypothetical protein [Corynebacterium sp. TAE3-ERU2]MBV7302410.1 hypothetical protein [Corynebacterium sp. TAE3-ERU2]
MARELIGLFKVEDGEIDTDAVNKALQALRAAQERSAADKDDDEDTD